MKTPTARNNYLKSRQSNSTQINSSYNNNNNKGSVPQTAKNAFRGKKLQHPLRMTDKIDEYANYSTKMTPNNLMASTTRHGFNKSPLNFSMFTPTSKNTRVDEHMKMLLPKEYEQDNLLNNSTRQAYRILSSMN